MTKFVRMISCAATRNTIAFVTIVFAALAYNAHSASAQSRPLPYWQHSQWVGENGPPIPGYYELARSADGYLWLGALDALIRFDGVRFTVFDSTNTPAFRGRKQGRFSPRLLDKGGVLWIQGPAGSLFTYANGAVSTVFEDGASGLMIEDGAGRLWLSGSIGIVRIEGRKMITPDLPDEVLKLSIYGVEPDTSDGLWIGTYNEGLWHVRGNQIEKFGTGRIRAVLQSRDGIVWALGELPGLASGLWQLVDGHFVEVHPPGNRSQHIHTRFASEAVDGSVWFITDAGLLRWQNGAFEQFDKQDGLSNNRVHDVFADRDGAVWATTDAGLDRLRPALFAAIEKRNGYPYDNGGTSFEDTSGAVWVASGQSAYLLDNGIIRNRPGNITQKQLPISGDRYFQLIAPSRAGGVWFGPGAGGVLRLTTQGVATVRARNGFPPLRIGTAFERRDGTLLVRTFQGEWGWFKNGTFRPSEFFERNKQDGHVWTDDESGRLWLVSHQERVTVLAGDSIVSQFELPQREDDITSIVIEHGDTAWTCTKSALIRIIGRHSAEIKAQGLDRILSPAGRLVISHGFLWIASTGGFARIPLNTLHHSADSGVAVSSVEVFGPLDGLTVAHAPDGVPLPIRVDRDGRVWVTTPDGLAVADPEFRMPITQSRTVRIEELSVANKAIPVRDGAKVLPLPTDVTFRFTVPTLLLAERVHIQYRLDGADDHWIDASIPRVATYNQLRPGQFVFRVRAWDETGQQIPGEATISFRVMPTWYQSWWFTLLVIAAAGGALLLVYQLRVRQLSHAYNVRLEERWAERTRIARELHDTLLQGFQGLMFHLQAARDMLPAQTFKAMPALDAALQKGEAVIDQARSAVGDLRSSENVPRNFDEGLAAIAAEAVHQCKNGESPAWAIDTKGRSRQIPPTVLYELYQVAKEAVCNAFRHARATHVSIEVRYGINYLRIAIADDGIGFDEASFSPTLRETHFGLRGIRERVARLGGEVVINSRSREGTRVMLSIPATVAYQRNSRIKSIGRLFSWRKKSDTVQSG